MPPSPWASSLRQGPRPRGRPPVPPSLWASSLRQGPRPRGRALSGRGPRPHGRPLTCAVSRAAGVRRAPSGSRSACSGRRRTRKTSRTSWTLPALPQPTTHRQVSAVAWADEAGTGRSALAAPGRPPWVREDTLAEKRGARGSSENGALCQLMELFCQRHPQRRHGPKGAAVLAIRATPPQNRGCHWRAPVLPRTVVLPDCEHPHARVCVCARAHTGTHISLSS